MVSRDSHHLLGRLSETDDLTVIGDRDLRGRRVVDGEGNEFGTVDDLVVDLHDQTVRLLWVRHGGVLGLGTSVIFVPVEAVRGVDQDRVWIDLAGQDEHFPVNDADIVESDARTDGFGEEGNPPFPLPGGLGPAYPAEERREYWPREDPVGAHDDRGSVRSRSSS